MALRGDPDRKEWHVGLAIAKYTVYFYKGNESLRGETIETIKHAKTRDPDNLYISALYFIVLANVGKQKEETLREVHALTDHLNPGLDGLGEIIYFLRVHDSLDSALQVAEEIVRRYPSKSRAKKQLATCYKWKIFESRGNLDQELMRKGIGIYEEVISLYPYYLKEKTVLADIYAESGNLQKADQIYMELLSKTGDLGSETLQLLYHSYANYLYWKASIYYHKKAAEIPVESQERENSIRILRTIASRPTDPNCGEIRDFLSNLELN
ncbi:antiviral innate immune response effector IFIT1-like [Alosa pseudoharengus]|uniref:antiviral innate immune response effector IFIT1-like n=1 Tax=Alosa pseudoharengus TaxID=34774 RepID=UPI003F893BC7